LTDHSYSGDLDVEVYGDTILIFAKKSHSLYIHHVIDGHIEEVGELHNIIEFLKKIDPKKEWKS